MSVIFKVGFVVCVVVASAAVLHAAEPVQLTRDGRLKFATTVCSNGREVVYCELANPALYRLMKLNLQDRTSQPLHPKAETSEFDPAFAADGKTYAFLKTIGVLQAAIVIHDDMGNKLGQVAPAGGFSGLRSPAIAPDRSRVVYSFGEGGGGSNSSPQSSTAANGRRWPIRRASIIGPRSRPTAARSYSARAATPISKSTR